MGSVENMYNFVLLALLLYFATTIAKPGSIKKSAENPNGTSKEKYLASQGMGYKHLIEPQEENLHFKTNDTINKHQTKFDDTGGVKSSQIDNLAHNTSLPTRPIPYANTSYDDEIDDSSWTVENNETVDTRRLLYAKQAKHPYMSFMVYLQLAKNSEKLKNYKGWLCGGVIIHKYYVMTSAACVEDADHFYVVSGTSRWIDASYVKTDKCVCKNRRRVIWKCTPKKYRFDFRDSEKWAANDIAIVRVDRAFNLNVKEKHCEYATEVVIYNNITINLEVPGSKGFIIGWGSQGSFREGVYRRRKELDFSGKNSDCLQMVNVVLLDKETCYKKWAPRFRDMIKRFMICTKDILKRISLICDKKHAKCKEVEEDFRRHGKFNNTLLSRNGIELSESYIVDSDLVMDIELEDEQENHEVTLDWGRHLRNPDDISARRTFHGGFCENDHGGPLVVNYESQIIAIGIISTCKIHPKRHVCHGPFLYTSVYNNKDFISCAMYKDITETCRKNFQIGVTHDEWTVDWAGVDEEEAGQTGNTAEEEAEEQAVNAPLSKNVHTSPLLDSNQGNIAITINKYLYDEEQWKKYYNVFYKISFSDDEIAVPVEKVSGEKQKSKRQNNAERRRSSPAELHPDTQESTTKKDEESS